MSTKKKILIAIVIAVLGASWYGYKEYTRGNKDLADVNPDVSLSTKQLLKEFETNEQAANTKYLDKVLAVTGAVKEVVKDEKGYYTVVLGDEETMSSIRCSMDSVHQQDAAKLSEGKLIVIKGACTGFNSDELLGSDVILNRSVIDK